MSQCSINELSTELLIYIFVYLDVRDLSRLRVVCRRFRDVINAWDNVLIRGTTVVTNQCSEKFLQRCFLKIPTKLEKLRLQHNWTNGIYDEKCLFYVRRKYMPWLRLNKDCLWFSRGLKIFNYKRNKETIIETKPQFVVSPRYRRNGVDITKFSIQNDVLVGGLSDGGIYVQNLINENDFYLEAGQNCYTGHVDISPDCLTVACGMRSDWFKVYSLHQDPLDLSLIHSQDLGQRVWCVSYSENRPLLACSTSVLGNQRKSVWVFDTERFTEIISFKLGQLISSTLDLKWDGPFGIWSCGNDSHIRRWDLRTGKCEQKFHDAFGAGLYCLDYDYCNSVMAGTYLHGRVALWDVRSKSCVQVFFMRTAKGGTLNSPVYSLAFDSECLFAATDQNLNILDFSSYGYRPKRDYAKHVQ